MQYLESVHNFDSLLTNLEVCSLKLAENEKSVEPNNQLSVNEPLRPELPAEKKKSYRSALLKLRPSL